jgi:hypothetical protein
MPFSPCTAPESFRKIILNNLHVIDKKLKTFVYCLKNDTFLRIIGLQRGTALRPAGGGRGS